MNCNIEDDNLQTVVFNYNRNFDDSAILAVIRLEIGALAVWTPAKEKPITTLCRRTVRQTFQATEHRDIDRIAETHILGKGYDFT